MVNDFYKYTIQNEKYMKSSIKIENNISDLSKRFLNVLEVKNYSGYKLSKEVPEITESKLTFIRTGRNEPSKAIINALIGKFTDISMIWLLTGEGEMFTDGMKASVSKTEPQKGVPYYDLDFTAGFLEVTNNQDTKPDSYIDHPFFRGCDYVVRNSGQSMAKLINHGDAIGLVKINNWRDFFPFGEVYAIVTDDGFRMVKIITKGETEETYTLVSKPTESKKEDFPPQQIKKSSISSIFRVQASSHLF